MCRIYLFDSCDVSVYFVLNGGNLVCIRMEQVDEVGSAKPDNTVVIYKAITDRGMDFFGKSAFRKFVD